MGTPTGWRKSAVVALAVALALLAGCGRRRALHGADGGPADGRADTAGETSADTPGDATTADDARDAASDRLEASSGADAGFSGALVAFCADVAPHVCAARKRCQQMTVLDAECLAVEEARCTSQLDVWQAKAAAMGRLKLDATQAPPCLAFLDQARCNEIDFATGDLTACPGVLVGTVGDGELCVYSQECAAGYCDVGADFPQCTGFCASRSGVGGSCGDDPSRGCDLEISWCDWRSKTCVAKKARGEACTDLEGLAETQCANTDYCRSPHGVPCRHTPDDAADCTCAARAGLGAPCVSRDECRRDLYCVKGACAAEIPLDQLCPGRGCADGLVCEPTDPALGSAGACRPRPMPHQPLEGEDCFTGQVPCLGANLYCSGETFKCARLPTVGQRCFDYCDATAYCPFTPNVPSTCLRKKLGGATCSEGVECQSARCERPRGCSPINCPMRCADVCSYLSADGGI